MDLDVLKIYIIVHDESVATDDQAKQAAAQRFKDFRSQILPAKCYVLTLNGKKRPASLVQVSESNEQQQLQPQPATPTTATNSSNIGGNSSQANSASSNPNSVGSGNDMAPSMLSLSTMASFPFAQALVPPLSYLTESNFESISGAKVI
jgi:hypothetical protein